ncbi:response regulator [Colwellia sp. MSW7]|uniref:Response regulator n=1 Tax=Colwellia maritima TaxID=2912588 RepID=A0ABS9X2V4_9GAMM|nr:hybrid sensor histidine kinase/response regulator [Colwellia maritima]MCI2284558.1 response regulator [Colwellia maritima]
MLDGEITLESKPGHGSIFSITMILPVSAEPTEKVICLHPEVSQHTVDPLFNTSMDAPLVLAVDDHPINRDLLARQIKLLGLRAETAENGKVALAMWLEGRFDLVITDCHMPEMDGYAFSLAVRKLEAEKKSPRTPIIAWTANALAEEAKNCRSAEMDEVLVKPRNLIQLKQMLSKWLPDSVKKPNQVIHSINHSSNSRNIVPINYTILEQIETDTIKQIQILEDFIFHIHTDNKKLIKLLAQGACDDIKNTAHRMKGSSRMIGAEGIAKACSVIEQAAANGDILNARTGKSTLDIELKIVEAHLTGAKI